MREAPVTYRVCWSNGQDALYDEWSEPLRAVVLDTALEYAKRVSKKWKDHAIVWEGSVIRAYGVDGTTRWPERCKTCKGSGKQTTVTMYGTSTEKCSTCEGQGKVPEQ